MDGGGHHGRLVGVYLIGIVGPVHIPRCKVEQEDGLLPRGLIVRAEEDHLPLRSLHQERILLVLHLRDLGG